MIPLKIWGYLTRVCGLIMHGLILLAVAPAPAVEMPYAGQHDSHYGRDCTTAGCHAPAPLGGGLIHPPFLENNCLSCHGDHATSATALLLPDIAQVCLDCHSQVHPTAAFAPDHPPTSGDCLTCHEPHFGRTRGLLREPEMLSLCGDCHAPFLQAAMEMPYRHRHFDPQSECGNCHYAHREAETGYLRPEVSETCLTCHDLPIRSGGRVLENVARQLRDQPNVHGAIAEGGCSACHTPHGSVQPSLLREGYPAGSYGAYDRDNYALCWQCHDSSLVEGGDGTQSTGFRNGAVNLHEVHVARLNRGRACHLCHAAHATERPHLLRETMLFGRWEGPLVWTPSDGGGSCQTPCHREVGYER